jgi:triacylglycerol esterase/lipase EstA (alpha/beta hydrolase family)
MGGLVIRTYLNKYGLKKLGRVVMIAPPNNGSIVADILQKFKIYNWWFGPSGQQLISDQSNFLSSFGKINYNLGIIAGNKPFTFLPNFITNKPNDGLVSVESAILKNAKDHVVLPYNHVSLLFSKQTRIQALNFLKFGRFEHNSKSK